MWIMNNPMTKGRKWQNLIHYGFTLIEMIIVLIIMGIMLLVTLHLSGEQIQKVRDKTVKESILAQMQSRYSRNLWSSSIAGEMYNTLNITMENGDNKINFNYLYNGNIKWEDFFTDRFEIKYITANYNFEWQPWNPINGVVSLNYTPYKISCDIGGWNENLVMIVRVNDSKNYCFEINQKNCRLIDVSTEKCENMVELLSIEK